MALWQKIASPVTIRSRKSSRASNFRHQEFPAPCRVTPHAKGSSADLHKKLTARARRGHLHPCLPAVSCRLWQYDGHHCYPPARPRPGYRQRPGHRGCAAFRSASRDRGMATHKTQLPFLHVRQTSPQKKRCLHAPPPTKHGNQNQTEDRPKPVIPSLPTTRIGDPFQNLLQLHRPNLKIRGTTNI